MTRAELLAELLVERWAVRPTPTPPHMPLPQAHEPVDELAAARLRRARTNHDPAATAV